MFADPDCECIRRKLPEASCKCSRRWRCEPSRVGYDISFPPWQGTGQSTLGSSIPSVLFGKPVYLRELGKLRGNWRCGRMPVRLQIPIAMLGGTLHSTRRRGANICVGRFSAIHYQEEKAGVMGDTLQTILYLTKYTDWPCLW